MLFVKEHLGDCEIHRRIDAPLEPLVTVILPTYRRNKSGLLARAIRSVLGQTWTDYELIVMDDGSSDGTAAFLSDCLRADPRVVHVRHEDNCGLPALRVNEGITLARGRYVAFQFDDDEWRPEALARLVEGALASTEPSVVVGQALLHWQGTTTCLPGEPICYERLFRANYIANNAVLVPRALFDRYGMYDCHIGMRRLCDFDLWLRLLRAVPFVAIEGIVSDCHTAQPGSLELTVPNDLQLFRFLHDIPRDHLLTPAAWELYQIDAFEIGGVRLPPTYRRRFYEEQLVPYYLKFRHRFPTLLDKPMQDAERVIKDVVLVDFGRGMASTKESLLRHDQRAMSVGSYKLHRRHGRQIQPESLMRNADFVLLPISGGHEAVDVGQSLGAHPWACLVDEDLTHVGVDLTAASRILEDADAAWVIEGGPVSSALMYSRRIIPLPESPDASPTDWHGYEAAWRATEFHARTRAHRGPDGRPCVAYLFPSVSDAGDAAPLWRWLRVAIRYGIRPLAVFPEESRDTSTALAACEALLRLGVPAVFAPLTVLDDSTAGGPAASDDEVGVLRPILENCGAVLAHSAGLILGISRACRSLGIAHIASPGASRTGVGHGLDSWAGHCDLVLADGLPAARGWGRRFGTDWIRTAPILHDELLADTVCRAPRQDNGVRPHGEVTILMVDEGHGQESWRAVVAVLSALAREGHPVHLDYYSDAKPDPADPAFALKRATSDGTTDVVRWKGRRHDAANMLDRVDILLCGPEPVNMPAILAEAMAAGVLVVACPTGAIPELIVDGATGLLCQGMSAVDLLDGLRRALTLDAAERAAILERARRTARSEFRAGRGACLLFDGYLRALVMAQSVLTPVKLEAAGASGVVPLGPDPQPPALNAHLGNLR